MLQIYSPSCSTTAAAADVLFPGRMEKPLQARQPQQAHGTRGMEHLPPALQPTGICASPVPSPGHSWKAKLRGSSSGAAQRGLKIQALLRGCFHFHGVAVCPIPGHCSWQAEDTLPGAGMTPLRLAYTHPQHLSQEKAIPASSLLCSSLKLLPSQCRQTQEVLLIHAASQLNLETKTGRLFMAVFLEMSSLIHFGLQMFKRMHCWLLHSAMKGITLLPSWRDHGVPSGPITH